MSSAFAAATTANEVAGTSTAVYTSPARQQSHPSAAKAWVLFNNSGTILAAYNVSGIVKNSTGDFSVAWTVPFSSVNYSIGLCGKQDPGGSAASTNVTQLYDSSFTAAGIRFASVNLSTFQLTDINSYVLSAYGAQ